MFVPIPSKTVMMIRCYRKCKCTLQTSFMNIAMWTYQRWSECPFGFWNL